MAAVSQPSHVAENLDLVEELESRLAAGKWVVVVPFYILSDRRKTAVDPVQTFCANSSNKLSKVCKILNFKTDNGTI